MLGSAGALEKVWSALLSGQPPAMEDELGLGKRLAFFAVRRLVGAQYAQLPQATPC